MILLVKEHVFEKSVLEKSMNCNTVTYLQTPKNNTEYLEKYPWSSIKMQ